MFFRIKHSRLFRIELSIFGIIFIALIVSVISSAIALGGNFADAVRITDFALCEPDTIDGKLQVLNSLVLSPTQTIYACGYLKLAIPSSFPSEVKCLSFYLNHGTETIATQESTYCLPARSQFFSHPFTTSKLLIPGEYRLYVYEVGSRLWTESVRFEIRSNPD